jgi:two-component system response regulator RegA
MAKSLLLVDDDPAMLRAFEPAFSRAGYAVHLATTNTAAQRLAAAHAPEIAIVDLRIKTDWGLELIASLKRTVPAIRVILVSGYLSSAVTAAAMRAGAEDAVAKPIKPSELLMRIQHRVDPSDAALRRESPPTLAQAAYEHMSRVVADCNGNISEAARRLQIHRQSLQRHLKQHSTG